MADQAPQVPQVIYTGPTNKTLGLRHNAIYKSAELTESLRDLVKNNPALAHQFVPLERHSKTPRSPVGGPVITPIRKRIEIVKLGPPIKKR